MDYATRATAERSARRPAAELAGRRSTVGGLVDLRRAAAITQARLEGATATVQREGGPEEEELQMKAAPRVAQREGAPEDEELQMKAAPGVAQREGAPEEELQMKRDTPANRTGLPDALKAGVESLSGMAMDGVQVHYNSTQPAQLNALAYAQGTDIHLAPGQEKHLPHEAWHVVQQAQGRVAPTMQMMEGVPVNDDAGLEHEADVMGEKALSLGG